MAQKYFFVENVTICMKLNDMVYLFTFSPTKGILYFVMTTSTTTCRIAN
jgi:hypothetical protein